nr:hypothetical protein HmN_000982300 [Hymenolepis microstoma]
MIEVDDEVDISDGTFPLSSFPPPPPASTPKPPPGVFETMSSHFVCISTIMRPCSDVITYEPVSTGVITEWGTETLHQGSTVLLFDSRVEIP